MPFLISRVAPAAFASLLLCGAGLAQDAPKASQPGAGLNAEAKGGTSRGALSDLALGYRLYSLGQERKDPLVAIAAARVIASVPLIERQRDKTEKADTAAPPASEGKLKAAPDLAAVLAGARALASGDKVLLAMIADVEGSASRGRVGGPARSSSRVNAKATDVYTEQFRGGQLAEVAVIGDGDTDLDLYVYDENGNQICKDDDRTDRLFCQWSPRWSGPFRIQIVNRGSVYNAYVIATN